MKGIEASLGYITSIEGEDLPALGNILPIEDQERIMQFAEQMPQDLARGLAEAIVYGDNLGDVLENTFKRAAAALLESGLLSLLTGGKQGTSFGTIFSNIGSLFGGFRAAGGPVKSGTSYMVGERGPELFQPRVSGSIVPNHALKGSGGGTSVSLTINAPGATGETIMMIRRELAAAAPAIAAAGEQRALRSITRPRL